MKLYRLLVITIIIVLMGIIGIACGDGAGEEGNDAREIEGIYARDIEIEYDGEKHSITVENVLSSDEIYYRTSEDGEWYTVNPTFINAGEYTVYYKVKRDGYNEYNSYATVKIEKQIITNITASNVTYIYDGNGHGIEIKGSEVNDEITYSIDGEEFKEKCELTEVGEYIVYYRVDRINSEYRSSAKVVILPNVQGRYINRQDGLILLKRTTAIINDEEKEFTYDVEGNGTIEDDEISIENGVLAYKGNEYEKVAEEENVYKIKINEEQEIYITGGERKEIEITFENGNAIIKGKDKEEIITEVNGVNYCENAEERNYGTNDVIITIANEESKTITECEIELSHREEMTKEDIYETVIYDGEEHEIQIEKEDGITIIYGINGEYTEESPKYIEVGKYEIEIVYVDNEHLPKRVKGELTIAPRIDGIYYKGNEVIEIYGDSATINGEEKIMEYNDKWSIDGKEIEVTETGIRIGETEYRKKENEAIMVVALDGKYCVIEIGETDYIEIECDKEEGIVTLKDDVGTTLMEEEAGKDGITVTVEGVECPDIGEDGVSLYIIGRSDLNRSLPVVVIVSG